MFATRLLSVATALVLTTGIAFGQTLHEEIDRQIAARMGGEAAAPADDGEFVRRIYLDLSGTLPSPDQTRRFLADASADKRTQLIDRLLAAPEYPQRMADAVSVMLLERRDGQIVTDEAWRRYLQESFAANKPWNGMVREMIAADGADEQTRPALRLLADGGRTDPHLRTQDFARIFLGLDLKCAQCHDHPSIDDYLQVDYYGLYAYLTPSGVHSDQQKQTFLIEAVVKEKVPFQSVFHPDDKQATGPRLPSGEELAIPVAAAGEEFLTPAGNGLPGRPKFQPRRLLSENLTADSNRQFARNAVNRFWFQLLGRGLVHPLDLHHSDNPPSHPELLEQLTSDFMSHGYDVRWLIREITLSAAYQRSSRLPDGVAATDVRADSYRVALPRPLSAEQMARALAQALGHRARLDAAQVSADAKFTYKDYVNGRLPPPDNWRDLMILFSGTFGHPAGQAEFDFRPSVEHALFLENDRLIRAWLEPAPGTLAERLNQATDPRPLLDDLSLSVLTRFPTDDEYADLSALLQDAGETRPPLLQDLCVVLLTSAEFRLNH